MYSRREFCQTIGLLAVAPTVFPRSARAAQTKPGFFFSHKPVPGGGMVIGALEEGGNVLVMPSSADPVMVDAKFAHTASDLAQDVFRHLGALPALLINTHHHADHSGGNYALANSAKIVAHKNFNPRLPNNLPRYVSQAQGQIGTLQMEGAPKEKLESAKHKLEAIKRLKAEDFAAQQELTDALTVIEHGDVRIEVRHFGNGHTDNDLVVFMPKQNVLHMGDLLFHNLHPFIDRSAKANTVSWQNALREATKLGDEKTVVVPGHGEVTDKTALPKMIEYFDQLREVVEKAMKQGKSKETIAAMKPDAFKDRGFARLQSEALEAMYDEISEESH